MSDRREKLVWICTRVPYPPVTGHFLRSYNVMKGLAEHFDIYLFGFYDRGTSDADAARAVAALSSLCVEVHAEHVRSERHWAWLCIDLARSVLAWKPFVAVKYFSPRLASTMRDVMDRNAISVVHADSLPSGEYLVDLPHAKLLTNHNVEFSRLDQQADLHRSMLMRYFLHWQARLTRRYEIRMLRTIGNCVVVSEADRSVLQTLVPNINFFVVHNGADASTPRLPPKVGTEQTALWVGSMNDPYNRAAVLYYLQEIFPLVRSRLPQLRWRVVGSNPPPALVDAARRTDSGIDLAGFVERIRDEYARADIVVVPLTAGGGTKLKVLEAMAMGRAIVTTPTGAEGIHASDAVELEIAHSAKEFAQRVVDLMGDSPRREKMANAARALVERDYDWRVVDAQMMRAVAATIDNARSAAAAVASGPAHRAVDA